MCLSVFNNLGQGKVFGNYTHMRVCVYVVAWEYTTYLSGRDFLSTEKDAELWV